MKGLIYASFAILVMALGFWAYRENYATQASLKEVRQIVAQISAAKARLDRLEAEWAFLNRPDRLSELVNMSYGRLELIPLQGTSYAKVDRVPLPFMGPPPPPQTAPSALSSYIASTSASSEEPL